MNTIEIPAVPDGYMRDEKSQLFLPQDYRRSAQKEVGESKPKRRVNPVIATGLAIASMLVTPAAQADTLTFFGTSKQTELYDKIHGAKDSSLTLETESGLSIMLEANRTHGFEDGTDFARVSQRIALSDDWTLTPAIRITSPAETQTVLEGAVKATRKLSDGALNLVAVYDGTDFGVLRAFGSRGALHGGLGLKMQEVGRTDGMKADAYLGLASARAGIFVARSTQRSIEVNGYAALPGFANAWAYGAHKDFPGSKSWSFLCVGAYAAGERPNALFTPGAGAFTAQATTDQIVHPLLGPFDGVGQLRAPLALELASFRDPSVTIRQATLEGRLFSLGGIELYAGPSVQWRDEGAEHTLRYGAEASLIVPVKGLGELAVDYRHMPGPMADNQVAARLTLK